MSTEYIEINSAYRNRVEYPLSSDFVVPIAQSGNKTAITAVDPISKAYPQIIFTPFTILNGILAPAASTLSGASSTDEITVGILANAASQILDYYKGIVMVFTNGGIIERHRIRSWRYYNTVAGVDYFSVGLDSNLSSAQVAGISTFTMQDPSNLIDSAHPLLYIPMSISADNYYIKDIVYNQTRNEWLPIRFYDGIYTHIAYLDPTSSNTNYTAGTWSLNDTFIIRQEYPMQYGQNIIGINLSTAVIVPPTLNAPSGSFVGNFIRVISTNDIVRIVGYTAGTNIITVFPYFSVIPVGPYEMLQFSYDNEGFLPFNNSFTAIREAVCYEVSLINIVLPNFILNTAQGSRSRFYPYVYVEFRSEKNSNRQGSNSIISNNLNATRMLFRALTDDNVDPLISPSVSLNGNGMVQRIKLDPQSSYKFSVHLPDGSLFSTILPEYYSPAAPNPLAQISALFSFKRLE